MVVYLLPDGAARAKLAVVNRSAIMYCKCIVVLLFVRKREKRVESESSKERRVGQPKVRGKGKRRLITI